MSRLEWADAAMRLGTFRPPRKHDWDIREDGEYSGERWTCWNCRKVCDPRITSQKGMKEQLREEACPGRP